MVTATGEKTYDLRGLSSDTKPTENIGNGSSFLEMDTGKVFVLSVTSESQEWMEI